MLSKFLVFVTLLLCQFSVSANADMDFKGDLPVFKWIELSSFPGMKVPVYKSEGTMGPGVLFIHGNSSSSRAFHKQIYSDLGRKYKMFFMDMPGHGLASKVSASQPMPTLPNSNEPAGFEVYQKGVPEAVSLVANDPEVQAKIIVGWSLGGHVAIKTHGLGLLPNVKGIFVYGTAPATRYGPIETSSFLRFGLADQSGMSVLPSLGLSVKLSPFAKGLTALDAKFTDPMPWYTPRMFSFYPSRGYAYMNAFFDPNGSLNRKIPDFVLQDGFERSDDRFRTSLAVMALEVDERRKDQPNELELLKIIGSSDVILGVALGERDMFINPDYLQELKTQGYLNTLWDNEIKVIENSGHASQLEQPEAFNKMIEEFILDVVNEK